MLSIIVSWRDRDELVEALPGLASATRSVGGDLTVVNYGGSRGRLARQLDGYPGGEVAIVEVSGERYFNKARAQNLGAGHSSHPYLFFCDCDVVLEGDTIRTLVERLESAPGHFATLAGVRESEVNSRGGRHVVRFGYELRLRTADGRELTILDHEEDAEDGTRQAPGLLLVRRTDFLDVGGYNSRLHGWGWEDQDMISRLTLGAGLARIQHGTAVHLSHDDDARVQAYPLKDRWESRDRMFRQALANYDRADFSGTYELDLRTVSARLVTGRPPKR